ncbi:hypothetical protein OHAE_3829 [Ochrobactrum soli]|uniref:Uncharacterized protein n=1 Tax=Ochrobactrum soli TaxID=2448455 RepID=A0A2P9HIH2_9HYPH|nr:hypothetical protein OHAE_3829 [[Ochrobactrum] soli]
MKCFRYHQRTFVFVASLMISHVSRAEAKSQRKTRHTILNG